jgi:hypothetical protein
MNATKTLTAAIALTSLFAVAGSALADTDPHAAYKRVFYGTVSTSSDEGRAAIAAPTRLSAADGHAAYNRIFYGVQVARVQPQSDTMGKAAFGSGSGSPSIDGQAAYRSVLLGD